MENGDKLVSPNLLLLLRSISPRVNEQDVQKILQKVNSVPENESEESSVETSISGPGKDISLVSNAQLMLHVYLATICSSVRCI